ncbi:hypothetical protein N7513_004785 [Penicillium frequentans]|uniref:Uncharacterized protein n=1 Tax=Penicillium frequentans TaxID=3151616 RepID=A0AAD6CRN1_9EURO|nr:hypothetical protein N7494_006979 [Penicillium glabrum]KAJ5543643.1 hypothetical protein N7513_007151 [Penicillium glabrum]KAJ5547551.1 hypothetical protein N7513_004785 [Penicillium glabrum]
MRYGGWFDQPSVPASERLDSIAAHAGQNDQGVGSSGISGKMKGAVRRAEMCSSQWRPEKKKGWR